MPKLMPAYSAWPYAKDKDTVALPGFRLAKPMVGRCSLTLSYPS
jgi:hypothetical protein